MKEVKAFNVEFPSNCYSVIMIRTNNKVIGGFTNLDYVWFSINKKNWEKMQWKENREEKLKERKDKGK